MICVLKVRHEHLDLTKKFILCSDEHVKHCIISAKRFDVPCFINKKNSWILLISTRQQLDQILSMLRQGNSEVHNEKRANESSTN